MDKTHKILNGYFAEHHKEYDGHAEGTYDNRQEKSQFLLQSQVWKGEKKVSDLSMTKWSGQIAYQLK